MNTPVISIIVPVYNAEAYLQKCLTSIISQPFTDWECILVDDGSKDGSASICDKNALKDGRFKVIHKNNEGVSCARNIGIDIATGEWIMFVDSDDWLEGDVLSLPSIANKDADLLIIDCITTNLEENSLDHYASANYDKALLQINFHKLMFRQCMLGPWSKFFRREVLVKNKIKFDKDIKWAEDRLFNLQFLSFCKSIQTMGRGNYVYYYPNVVTDIMKYHPTVPMIHDLYNKMREAALKLDAPKAELVYLILWRYIEKVALLSDSSQEQFRKAFFKENATFRNLMKLNLMDIPYFILCAFTPVTFHKKFLYNKLGIVNRN